MDQAGLAQRLDVAFGAIPADGLPRRRSPATARAWPSVQGDFRSTKFATPSSAASSCSPSSRTPSAGSAPMTASHV